MEKQDFMKLVQELNYQSLNFINIANKEENSYYHIFSISFKTVKAEMYLGEFPIMMNLLKISIKRLNYKNQSHKIINVEDPESTDELFDWNLPGEAQVIILKAIEKFSNKVKYLDHLKCLTKII